MITNLQKTRFVVIYADDDQDDLLLMREAFSKYDNSVEMITVNDGTDLLEYLNVVYHTNLLPILIILDINMPKLNGKETLKAIRKIELFNTIPVILYSTSSSAVDKEFASQHEATFFSKPYTYSELEKVTEKFLEHIKPEIRQLLLGNNNH
jgi:CheY-like chemotaxis protein